MNDSQLIPPCDACSTNGEPLFCWLPPGDAAAADSVREYPRGTLLFNEGQTPRGVYVLYEGRVKLSTCSGDARVLITDIAGPGYVLGLSAVVSGRAHEVSAEALDACRLVCVEREEYLRLLGLHPCALTHATRQLSSNYLTVHRQASVLGLSPTAAGKLACLLLEHPSLNGGRVGRGLKFKLVLTHEEIGQLIGASRETVTRLLNDFRRKKLIEVSGETLVVRDRKALETLAPTRC
jgi:CRP/FNR family transcriptional regulator, cyclic AMP receptor protein